ncbi:E3 SUMO-protein ligase ZBED1-like [Styela clava]
MKRSGAHRRKSVVWHHFKEINNNGIVKVKCFHCGETMAFHNSTSNMLKHMNGRHPFVKLQEDDIQSCSETCTSASKKSSNSNSSSISAGSQNLSFSETETSRMKQTILPYRNLQHVTPMEAKRIDDGIVNMVVGDLRPINIVSGRYFQNLVAMLAPPGYTIPSRQTITTKVEDLYREKKEVVMNELLNATYVALTTDAWTSIKHESYLCVTAHILSQDFNINSFVLSTKQLDDKQTGENIAGWIQEIVSDFGVPFSKIVSITTDNGSNMIAAVNLLKREHNLNAIRCAAHTLQLCLQRGFALRDIVDMLETARKIVNFFRRSASNMLCLRKKYEEITGKPLLLDLIIDVSTRWNSTYEMLLRLNELKWHIRAVVSELGEGNRRELSHLEMKEHYWEILQDLLPILQPFKVATAFLEGNNYITLSSLKPVLKGLVKKISVGNPNENTRIVGFRNTVFGMLNSYFEICLKDDGSTIFDIAYVLDARYKTKSMKQDASRKVKNLLQFEVENIYTSEIEQPAVQQSGMATELHERNNKSCIENLINDGMDSSEESGGDVGELTREMEVSAEISKYLNDRYLGLSATQEEMLQWWKRNKKVYPNIAVVVQKYLCISVHY